MSNLAHSISHSISRGFSQNLPGWIPRPAQPERHLRPVPAPTGRRKRPTLAYAFIALSTIGAIVAVQLVLSVSVANGAYELSALQASQTEVQRDRDAVAEDIERLRSPQFLANNAAALGMVTNSAPVFLRLSDGAVLGLPAEASGAASGSSLVPNALLGAVPLVTDVAAAPPESTSGAPQKVPATTPAAPVPLQGGLPSPTTR